MDMKENELIEKIKNIVKNEGMISLSLACGDYRKIWYDRDADKVFVKYADVYTNSFIYGIEEVSINYLRKIYEDIKELE